MLTTPKAAERAATTFRKASDCRIEDLAELTSRKTAPSDYPFAADVQSNVLIYDCNALGDQIADPHTRPQIMTEWADAMMSGPGVLVLKRAETDHAMIDRASEMFRGLIAEQNRLGTGGGDHFAKPGANDRLWNSLEKHCLADPENFLHYYGNPFLAAVSEAWLGPNYQMTAQLNVVNPGGASQSPHRDYHLGFQTAADIERFPLHVHLKSTSLTLQGAIAHVDAPLETGPTLLLPFSQLYPSGYLAMGLPAFRTHFEAHHVQLPLEKGDMLFFSPALLHAAGSNRSADVRRMVNLFQVSSAYGRAMESVNRTRMIKALYPAMLRARNDGTLTGAELAAAIAASAEGYAFPTNLDNDPPIGGIAPRSQAALVTEALAAGWPAGDLFQALDAQEAKHLA